MDQGNCMSALAAKAWIGSLCSPNYLPEFVNQWIYPSYTFVEVGVVIGVNSTVLMVDWVVPTHGAPLNLLASEKVI